MQEWTQDVSLLKLCVVPQLRQVLDISFSPIARDARVLRQLEVAASCAEITTVGYGPASPWSTHHVEVPAQLASLPQNLAGVLALTVGDYAHAQRLIPAATWALKSLAGRNQHFDAVIANDARALPLAFAVAGRRPVWADMHEWAPEENNGDLRWRILVGPFMDWLCATYLPRASAVTSVSPQIVDLYQDRYAVHAELMRNAGPYQQLSPTAVNPDGPIRLVHSGIAKKGRNIAEMIRAVQEVGDTFTLDLFLLPAGDGGKHLASLQSLAAGDPRIRFQQPVAPEALPATLNQFDAGLFVLPPSTRSYQWALPNKFFDFIQARLAVITGPTEPMADLVHEHHFGVVTEDFSTAALVRTLQGLTPHDVSKMKVAADGCARSLSFEAEGERERKILSRLLGTKG